MMQVDDLSRSLIAFEQLSTLVIVVELSQSSWLAAGVVPGIERRPLKKLDPDPTALLHLVEGWRDRATKAGRAITRTVLAFESGRDGGWRAFVVAWREGGVTARPPPSQDGSARY